MDTAAISRIALAGTARLTDTLASNGGSYLTRRRDEQKTDREIRRCLKRYTARHMFRLMEAAGAK